MIRRLIRATTRGLCGLTLVALVLGHLVPSGPLWRSRDAAPMAVVGAELLRGHVGPMLHEAWAGRLRPLDRPPGSRLAWAAVSPWRDDRGHRQVVGLEWAVAGRGAGLQLHDMGIVRFEYPGGATLDHVPLGGGATLSGPPCWAPGTAAEVLFARWDGRLYRLAFERRGADGGIEPVSEPAVEPVAWDVEGVPGGVFLADPNWPTDLRLGGRVLAALRRPRVDRPKMGPWELWWLKLDADGRVVEAAGRLTRPDAGGGSGEIEERFPHFFVGPGRTPMLAFLEARTGEPSHRLRVAPLRWDARTGAPYVDSAETRTLAEGCLPAPPLATADGRSLSVLRGSAEDPRARRVSLSEARPRSGGELAAGDSDPPRPGSMRRELMTSDRSVDRVPSRSIGSGREKSFGERALAVCCDS